MDLFYTRLKKIKQTQISDMQVSHSESKNHKTTEPFWLNLVAFIFKFSKFGFNREIQLSIISTAAKGESVTENMHKGF